MINQNTMVLLDEAEESGAGSFMDIRNGQGSTITLNVTIGNSSNVVKLEGCLTDADSTATAIGVVNASDYSIADKITASGIYFACVTGLEKVRANVTTYSSGKVTVVGTVVE